MLDASTASDASMPDNAPFDPHELPAPVGTPRRTFVARLAAVLTTLPLLRHRAAWSARSDDTEAARHAQGQPNAAILAAIGTAVFPTELGPRGTARAVADFQQWMDDYRPGAEVNHGYGTGTIQQLPADPRPAWRAQLTALDEEARRARGTSFAALSRSDRQAMLRTALASERGESLPSPITARHIAIAMLAHFYESPAATDLCYEATIGRQQCRPLSAAREQPVPITRRAP